MPSTNKIVNVASVPQRSPFRYPGGKTWLVPFIRQWLKSRRVSIQELVEPFAGGGIVGLTAAFEELAKHVTLVEIDPDVAAVWQAILNGSGEWLADRIAEFRLTPANVRAVLNKQYRAIQPRAFATILRNRVQRGGILAPGAGLMKEGESGRGVASRWYPETLRKRILAIIAMSERIRFVRGDGLEFIGKYGQCRNWVFFIDPPYTVAGRRLYKFSEIDHRELFQLAKRISGDFLMTYDDSEEIRQLAAKAGFQLRLVAMKNTHNSKMMELLIGKDLSWFKPLVPGDLASSESSIRTRRGLLDSLQSGPQLRAQGS